MENTDASSSVINQVLKVVESGKIDPETRDILLFGALADIYSQFRFVRLEITQLRKDTQPAVIFSKVGLWFASAIGLGVITFIGGLLTGRIQLIFR